MNSTISRPAVAAGTFALIVALTFSGSAQAQDYTLGANARNFAMGGAGLALVRSSGSDGRANPASLAYERNNVAPTFPSLGVRSEGPATSNAGSSYLYGGAKQTDAISLAGVYGSAPSTAGINGYLAFRVGKLELSSNGVGLLHVRPNASWANWVQHGNNEFNTLPADGQVDLFAAGYYTLPAVGYATTLRGNLISKNSTSALGLRVKDIVGVYSHQIVNAGFDAGLNHTAIHSNLAPEMNNTRILRKSGIGADMGFLVRPKGLTGVSAGLVAENFIKPSIVFNSPGAGQRFSIIPSSLSAGLGFEARTGLTLAADLINIGGGKDLEGNGTQDMRVGMEQRFFKVVAVRGGYSKLSGATYGFGFFGFDVALGKKVPLEVVRSLNF